MGVILFSLKISLPSFLKKMDYPLHEENETGWEFLTMICYTLIVSLNIFTKKAHVEFNSESSRYRDNPTWCPYILGFTADLSLSREAEKRADASLFPNASEKSLCVSAGFRIGVSSVTWCQSLHFHGVK